MANLKPGALILRLLLAPDQRSGIGVAREHALILLDWEGIELLDAHDRDITLPGLAPRLEQIEIYFAAAEHDALRLCRVDRIDLIDDVGEAALTEIGQRRYRQLVAQQALGRHHDQW